MTSMTGITMTMASGPVGAVVTTESSHTLPSVDRQPAGKTSKNFTEWRNLLNDSI